MNVKEVKGIRALVHTIYFMQFIWLTIIIMMVHFNAAVDNQTERCIPAYLIILIGLQGLLSIILIPYLVETYKVLSKDKENLISWGVVLALDYLFLVLKVAYYFTFDVNNKWVISVFWFALVVEGITFVCCDRTYEKIINMENIE